VMLLCLPLLQAKAQLPAHNSPNSLLWKISGNNMMQPSFLYGTMHMMCEKDFKFPPGVITALQATQQLYLELNMDDSTMLRQMQQLLLMPEDYSLKKLFAPEDYRQLNDYLKKTIGVDAALFDRMKPMALTSLLTVKLLLPCTQPFSIEKELLKNAKAQQKSIAGLETLEDQMAVFDSIPDKEEAAALVDMLRHPDEERAQFDSLLHAYQRQDIQQLYNLTVSSKDIGPFRDILLDRRNARWIPLITQQIQATPTFFAVGAGHLGGPNGVIALLRRQGYRVEPVK
ncbi:MAG TPA: TraB/GumN family protein, partial [Chitinophaga sp.]|uniref:TraB/GumN family protein n=1 Tax=Chitinophaga sp. TaxID=1869181 RepID=UPI002DB6705D